MVFQVIRPGTPSTGLLVFQGRHAGTLKKLYWYSKELNFCNTLIINIFYESIIT